MPKVPYADSTTDSDCYIRVDAALLFPHLDSLLSTIVFLDGQLTTVSLSNARLNTTVSPLIQLGGYRLGPGYPELEFTYRFLATDGRDVVPGFDPSGAATRRSRFDLQVFRLDVARDEFPLGPKGQFVARWEAGILLQAVFFDTQALSAASFQQGRNSFFGIGPQVGLTLTRTLSPAWALFGRVEGALALGYNTTQSFLAITNDPVAGILSDIVTQQQSQPGPSFGVQAGVGWTPASFPASRFRAGYQLEQWYEFGQVGPSRGDLSAHGLFLGGEYQF